MGYLNEGKSENFIGKIFKINHQTSNFFLEEEIIDFLENPVSPSIKQTIIELKNKIKVFITQEGNNNVSFHMERKESGYMNKSIFNF